jgi:hypothetical protein
MAPLPAPWPIGTKVRYVGTTSFRYGDNPMVQPGDTGVVVEVHAGTAGYPHLGPELAEPTHGWSTVVIKGNRLAVDAEDAAAATRYVRA